MRGGQITPNLKKAIWDVHIGGAVSQTQCPLCGINTIYQTRNSGFEAAHIVAAKFDDATQLTPLHLYPTCKSCNNACSDLCLLDYLWCRERIVQLRAVIWSLYKAFMARYSDQMPEVEQMAWKVLRHLYGSQRYPAGGGIANEIQIYEIAKAVEFAELAKEGAELSKRIKLNAQRMEDLLESRITMPGYRKMC